MNFFYIIVVLILQMYEINIIEKNLSYVILFLNFIVIF